MNSPVNISTGSIIPSIRLMLNADMKTLNKMVSGRNPDSKMAIFINSLLKAKEQIINTLPGDVDGTTGSAHPPQQNTNLRYSALDQEDEIEQSKLLRIIKNIESNQATYVRNSYSQAGLPQEVESILTKVIKMYGSIEDQLNRSKMTNDISPIEL